ncbi:MAG: restriction endonuclease subunit S, partial [Pseudomonadota bacterium]|nr:restriction endonuclease subunit S [Pseudomonadota bacterium]
LLNDVGEIVTGKTPSTKNPDNFGGNIPFIKPADLDNGGYVTRTAETLTDAGAKLVPSIPANSIPVTCIGNLGKVGITTQSSATNQQINTVVPSSQVDYRFVYYQLQTLKPWMQENASATTVTIINKGKFSKAPVALPPLAEQKVIADKLDTLLAQVENTKARLERIPQILKRFRQSVLAAAVSGRLTEMPSASATERVTLGQIAVDIRYGTSKKCSESAGSTPVLRIPNVGDGYINQNNLKFADFDEKERAKLALQQGDLLLIRSNGSLDLVGKTALAQDKDIGLLFAGYLIRVRLDNQIADPAYVSLCLRSPETRAIIEEKAKSTSGVNNINSKELASLELSLPSTEIQQEIVRRVDQLFTHADRIEQQVNNALARINNLAQSILAKAFRGELTEQWRKDNPELISGENSAEALLERIKAERAAMKPAKKSRQKRTTA